MLLPAPGVTAIKEFRGSMVVSVMEKEESVSLDLSKEVTPIETSRGTFAVIKNGIGGMTILHLDAAGSAGASSGSDMQRRYLTVRFLDADGKDLDTAQTMMDQTFNLQINARASQVKVSWPGKVRDVVIPVEGKDLPVPPPAPRPIVHAIAGLRG